MYAPVWLEAVARHFADSGWKNLHNLRKYFLRAKLEVEFLIALLEARLVSRSDGELRLSRLAKAVTKESSLSLMGDKDD